jgi:hypothetical protein
MTSLPTFLSHPLDTPQSVTLANGSLSRVAGSRTTHLILSYFLF